MLRASKVVTGVLVCLCIASPVAAYYERQNFYDWLRLRNYVAPADIAQLATDTTMDPKARKIFYVNHPQLQNKTDFQQSCKLIEKTIVLGCYKAGVGIFVYDVTDERLHGVQQVTSAHEMLHAAYERLSDKDRKNVDALTQQAFTSLTDQRVIKNIEAYRSRDASVVPNELHSILGTEVRTLPPALETYYKRYFTDRQKIVGYSEQYEAEFTSREAIVAAYDAQLKDIKSQIDTLNATLASEGAAIDSDEKRLKDLLAAHEIDSYNAGIPAYQAKINAYNNNVRKLRAAIDSYNSIVDRRNSIVTEEQQLINAIDSSTPATK